jgi:uncharacterized protein (TIGR03437 family)
MRLFVVFAAAAPLFAQTLCPDSLAPAQPFNIPAVSYTIGQIAVHADYYCTWTYSTDSPSWITFASGAQNGTGTGPGGINWSATANVTPYSRSAKIIVTGAGAAGNVLTFAIIQAGAVCAITLPQPSASIGVSGGSGTFPVQANCTWNASSSGWITVPYNTKGTGDGTVSYTVAANPCATQRNGAIPVTSYTVSQQFQINQDGSTSNFAISPTSATVPPAGATGNTIYVTTGGGCPWNTTVDVSWITLLSGRSSSGPGGFGYSVPANSGPQRTGHITVQPAGNITGQPGQWVVTVTQQALPPPAMQLNAVVNAASNVGSAVSPGEIVTLYGTNIGPTSPVGFQVNADGTYAKSLGGAQVLFDDVPAGVTYASAVQVNAVAPYSLAGKSTTQVQVEYQGVLSNAMSVPVQAAHPGLFTVDSSGLGAGAILNQNYSLNGGRNPAARGSVVMIYCTGGGVTDPASVDATITPAPPTLYLLKTSPVSVTIGGIAATVSYSGAAPSQIAGLTQINAQVPAGVTPGTNVPVVVTIGTWQSQLGVTMAVQ